MTQEKAVRNLATQINPAWTHTDDDGSVRTGTATWAVVDANSGVILRYGEEDKIKATCSRWNDNPRLMPSKVIDKAASAVYLLSLLSPGDTVQTILRHVSRSGMMRHISVVFKGQDITQSVANVLNDKIADDGGIKVGGCGMDMGFGLIYNLGAVLWPMGTSAPHGRRNGKPDSDGGYALRQAWL
jgi:hypothetical protein